MSDDRKQPVGRAPGPQRVEAPPTKSSREPRARSIAGRDGGPHLDFASAEQAKPAVAGRVPEAANPDAPTDAPAGGAPADRRSTRPSRESTRPDPSRSPASGYQLEAIGLKKSFHKGAVEIPVLKGVDLGVRRGELLAVVGQSGSGKSTLLHLLATLDAPDDGEIHYDGRRIDRLPNSQRDPLRNRHLGMIFQFYHLLPELTTLENVLVPVMIGRSTWKFFRHRRAYRQIATELLAMVGLSHRLNHKPRELSGGEMQRAAIARALIPGPELLLADEPTGNLDQTTGGEILEILYSLNRQHHLTIVMVTHDPEIARQADRIVRLVDGRVETV
jgi:lipoprotein-releasing system ATP-binding protein